MRHRFDMPVAREGVARADRDEDLLDEGGEV
jgi:hypothetical protein